MARKVTKKELFLMVSELLASKPVFDRFKKLQEQIKEGMVELDLIGEKNGIEAQQGRVYVTQSDRVTISAELAEEVLGEDAEKVIVVKRSVPNKRVEELKKAKVISEEHFQAMRDAAKAYTIVNLYIRPLK